MQAERGKPTDNAQHFTLLLSFLAARPGFPSVVYLFFFRLSAEVRLAQAGVVGSREDLVCVCIR